MIAFEEKPETDILIEEFARRMLSRSYSSSEEIENRIEAFQNAAESMARAQRRPIEETMNYLMQMNHWYQ